MLILGYEVQYPLNIDAPKSIKIGSAVLMIITRVMKNVLL